LTNSTRLITDTELEVLKALWGLESATVRQLHETLADEGRPWAYTTVLTLLRRLLEKGYVKASKEGRAHIYAAVVQRGDLLRQHLDELKDRVCEGTTMPLMLTLFQGGQFSAKEIEHFRDILDQLEGEGSGSRKKARAPRLTTKTRGRKST